MKDEWENFVDKTHNFKTLSELVRNTVNDYIFPNSTKRAFDEGDFPEDFESYYKGYLSRIDNWKNYKRIREIEQIINEYNAMVPPEQRREEIKAKLLDIQQYLLSVIFEISSIIPD